MPPSLSAQKGNHSGCLFSFKRGLRTPASPFPHALIPRQLRLGQPASLSWSAEKSSSNEQSASEASSNEAPQRGSKQYPYVAVGVTAPLIGLGWPKGNPLKALFA